MRLITGAILILAGSFLLGISELKQAMDRDVEGWIIVYYHVLAIAGIGLLLWGFVQDLSISLRRRRRKGDR